MEGNWIKVEVIDRRRQSLGSCLVQRIDGSGSRFGVKVSKLAVLGSHDPESEDEVRKRVEFEKVQELLIGKGCPTISCSCKAYIWASEGILEGVRDKTVDHIISRKAYFSQFEPNIDQRLSEQLMNCSWGGNMEIAASSELYDIGILVWELSESGELVTPVNNIRDAKDHMNLHLVRHHGVHTIMLRGRIKNPLLIEQGDFLRRVGSVMSGKSAWKNIL